MKRSRLQNKVAGSELTLPVCAVAAAILWWLPQGAFSVSGLLGLALCLLTTYIIMETNARQHIIRIRTRMVSCVWLALATCLPFMHSLEAPLISATFLCISYLLLFLCYQRHRPQAYVFHVFLTLGIGSFFAPVMLLMAVPFFLYLVVFLRSLTWKAFWAGLLGLVTPYWCYAVWLYSASSQSLSEVRGFPYKCFEITFSPLLGEGSEMRLFSFAVLALLCIVSIIHYLRTNYDDKIRVRMFLYIYIVQTVLLTVSLVLQPAQYETTMALLVASASPLIAHYFALSKGILNTIFFVFSLLLVAALAVMNLWMTSFSIF